jgi:hypothetical protein
MNTSSNKGDKLSLIRSVDRYCEQLHEIYESFPVGSQKRDVLAIAAKALLFSLPRDEFHVFLSSDELTPEQQKHVDQLGLESNEAEEST